MSADLTVPCTAMAPWVGARVVLSTGGTGTVVGADDPHARGVLAYEPAPDGRELPPLPYRLVDLALDLTDRRTRLEAIVRLGRRLGVHGSHLGASWTCSGRGWYKVESNAIICRVPCLTAEWTVGAMGFFGPVESAPFRAAEVPALAGIDANDATSAPGGARVVDVRALAIVLRHVFGGAA